MPAPPFFSFHFPYVLFLWLLILIIANPLRVRMNPLSLVDLEGL